MRLHPANHMNVVGASSILFALCVLLPGCGGQPASNIVAGTGHIAGIVEELGADAGTISTLIPPAMCPGHYDLKPSDVENLSHAHVVLLHDWQMPMGNIRRVLDAAKTPADRIHKIAVAGNWLVPETQASAAGAIASVLSGAEPQNADAYLRKAESYRESVLRHGQALRPRIEDARLPGTPVLSNAMQTPFAEWVGLDVAAEYQGGTDLSAGEIEALIEKGRAAGVVLVVDNLQSGSGRLSETLARETGTPRVVLSNFPGGFADAPDWAATVSRNVELLAAAMEKPHE